MTYTYDYPRPMVCVDIILVDDAKKVKKLLLIKRLNDPYKESWALPGGFVDEDEALIDAANRELEEETGIVGLQLKQFYAFGDPGRDPRGHSVSIVFMASASSNLLQIKAGDDAKEAQWFDINNLPELAFDHEEIIAKAMKL